MVVLGDIIYPDGLHPAEHEQRRVDSLRLTDQIEVISGTGADRIGARGIFVPGNHDWGQEEDWAGAVRLVRLQNFLQDWEGAAADRLTLSPDPGTRDRRARRDRPERTATDPSRHRLVSAG